MGWRSISSRSSSIRRVRPALLDEPIEVLGLAELVEAAGARASRLGPVA
jgi:hypothetical protein